MKAKNVKKGKIKESFTKPSGLTGRSHAGGHGKRPFKNPIIIAIASHKGGVGKSSLTAALAHGLASYVGKTLVMDFDSQANTTWMMCPHPDEATKELSDIFEYGNKQSIEKPENRKKLMEIFKEATVDVSRNGNVLHLTVSSLRLGKTQLELRTSDNYALFRARDIVKCIAEDYDLVLIDTPPSLEFFPNAAVASCDYLIIPMTPDALAVQGGQDTILHILKGARTYFNENVQLLGVIINKYHKAKVADAMLNVIRGEFGKSVFNAVISRSARVEEVTTYRAPLQVLSPDSKSNQEITELVTEVYERLLAYEEER